MRTEQQNPQPRSNQVSRSIGGLRNASPNLWISLLFHEGNAQGSRGVPAMGNGLKGHEPQVNFCKHWRNPSIQLIPSSHSKCPTGMWQMCLLSPSSTKNFLCWAHCLHCFSLLRQTCIISSTCTSTNYSQCIHGCTDQTSAQVSDYSGLHVTMAVSSKCSERN